MADSEALLLVDDYEAQFGNGDVLGEEAVRADYDINVSGGQGFYSFFLRFRRNEAAHLLDADGIVGHAVVESLDVLVGEDRGGDENGDLLAAHDGFEGGPDGDFRFAESDVAADKPVHGGSRFHIGFHFLKSPFLVVRLGIGERFLEACLPFVVMSGRETWDGFPLRLAFQKFAGKV